MGELGKPDHEDEEEEVFRPTSYDSLETQSMTSVNEKSIPEDEPANAEEEVLETKNEKEIEKNNKHEEADKEEMEKSSDPLPVGLIELVIILGQFPFIPIFSSSNFQRPLIHF